MIAISNPIMLMHKPKYPHPESPERLNIVYRVLERLDIPIVEQNSFKDKEVLYEVHERSYVERIEVLSKAGIELDPDTYLCRHSFDAALCAATLLIPALEKYEIVFGVIRPPGHHAGMRGRAMGAHTNGFCIFNNAAVLAKQLLKKYKMIGILDFDLHHGNGTQEIFYFEKNVIFCDIHQDYRTIFPGTGAPDETGGNEARGTKFNINLAPGATDAEFMESIDICIEKLKNAEVIVVSAGFDAYYSDGLSDLNITEESYAYVGKVLRENFSKIYIVLEGGYRTGLEKGLSAFLKNFI